MCFEIVDRCRLDVVERVIGPRHYGRFLVATFHISDVSNGIRTVIHLDEY